jgi:hypothetical protein
MLAYVRVFRRLMVFLAVAVVGTVILRVEVARTPEFEQSPRQFAIPENIVEVVLLRVVGFLVFSG